MISESVAKRLEVQREHGSLVGEAPASGVLTIDEVLKRVWSEKNVALTMRGVDPEAGPICTVTVPVKTVSEANAHQHWRIRQRRAKAQHAAVHAKLWMSVTMRRRLWDSTPHPYLPLHVHLTRLSPRKLDSDNLAGSLKAIRDAVAKFLGVDDGREDLVSWSWDWEPQKGYAVRVEFYRRQS